jgi:hypothetical protein
MIGRMATPERNNYFYGKLLDEAALKKEQDYGRLKSATRNRALVGTGVACGLRLSGTSDGNIVISPGLAIDAAGRELVVSEPLEFNPRQLTDDSGEPTGDDASDGDVQICLAYRQECADPVPVLVPNCGDESECAPSTIREVVAVIVRTPAGDAEPLGCRLSEEVTPGPALHEFLSELIADKDTDVTDDTCVSLGRIGLSAGDPEIRMHEGREMALGNDLLLQLILCLARRVDGLS